MVIATKHIPHLILGAGISGLSIGHFLQKNGTPKNDILILEASDRTGGWIQTIHHKGFQFELGPRSCRASGSGEETLALIHDLKLEHQLAYPSEHASKRYLYHQGALKPLPGSLPSLLNARWVWPAFPPLLKEWTRSKSKKEDESIASFFLRRTNPFITHTFIDALTKGIYAGDIEHLSMRSCFPGLWDMEQNHGSLTKALFHRKAKKPEKPLFTLKNGMQTLTDRLSNQNIKTSCPATHIHQSKDQWIVQTTTHTYITDQLYCTIPPEKLIKIWPEAPPVLSQFETTDIFVVSIGFHQPLLEQQGFGYLVPKQENLPLLGIVFDSSAFPSQNQTPTETRLTLMTKDPDCVSHVLKSHLNITQKPDAIHIKQAVIPQYTVGHHQKLQQIAHLPLYGAPYHGVSVNDCIKTAKNLENK